MKTGPFEELEAFLARNDALTLAAQQVVAMGRARVRGAWERAATREERLLAVGVYVSYVLSGVWLDHDWRRDQLTALFAAVAERADVSPSALSANVTIRLLRDPALLEMPPMLAVEALLRRLLTLAPLSGAALWTRGTREAPACLMRVGEPIDPDVERAIAVRLTRSPESGTRDRSRGPHDPPLIVAPIQRWLRAHGALIVRTLEEPGPEPGIQVAEAAQVLAPVLEREALLHRNNEADRMIVAASERRLEQLGLDLHDRPIQDLAALGADVRLLRSQLLGAVPAEPVRSILAGRIDDVEARLAAVHVELRELAQSLASPVILSCPLAELFAREAATFRGRSGMDLQVDLEGDLESLPAEQRMTLLRVVQEALTNAREHSGAASVRVLVQARRDHVEATVRDDGRGFDVDDTLVQAGERGRLGLVGISERARLLGGTCEIHSRTGGPTRISVFLPRMDPFAYEDERTPVPVTRSR